MHTHANPDLVRRPPTSQPAHLEGGDTLNERYRLDREVGRTEAGVVFDAVDLTSKRRVAVEIASSLEEPKARRKWARDAMLAQRLEGEHVLRVLDVGNLAGGVPFAVREAALCTLAAEVEATGALHIAKAVGWTLEACEAIAEAHALGMAHGDLRLDNIYLVRGTPEPQVKVAWTSAAKAERAAREDVSRDIAGLAVMLRILATGHVTAEDGATTLPSDLAHAVARALAQENEGTFHNVSDLARALAPFAPPGHTSARNVAFLLSRAGVVTGPIPTKEAAPRSSRRGGATIVTTAREDAAPATDRASFTDEWFGRASRTSLVGQVAPRPNHRGLAFALVSVALIALVLGGTWLLWHDGKLPRWTGAAPPESVGNTEVTSAPAPAPENATTTAAPPATAEAPPATAVESLPNAAPETNAAPAPTEAVTARPVHRPATRPAPAAEPAVTPTSELRYVDPPSSTSSTSTTDEATPTPAPATEPATPAPAPEREPGGIY
jgi:serine/threonine protein kinase